MINHRKIERYFLVGVINTIVGYGLFALFVWLLQDVLQYAYMWAAVFANILSVTLAFLLYKIWVFKSVGNWLAQYIKCWSVYGVVVGIGILCLPFLVRFSELILPSNYQMIAPYLGGLMMVGVTMIISFVGHNKITFKG